MSKEPTVWDKYWEETKFDNKKIINGIQNSFFWEELKREILNQFSSFKNLKIIELGSGRGEMSLLMALEGANITLVDESKLALEGAKKLYNEFNCKVNFINKNIFEINKGDFDISLSFGLAEHFEGEERLDIFKKHYNSTKKNGLIILSVPNSRCFPYRIYKSLTQLMGLWKYGREIPYSESGLINLAKKMDIKEFKILRSSFLNAFYHFLIMNPLKLISIKLKERFVDIKVLNKWGYALIFVGKK